MMRTSFEFRLDFFVFTHIINVCELVYISCSVSPTTGIYEDHFILNAIIQIPSSEQASVTHTSNP